MTKLDEEYKKGFQLALEGKDHGELFLEKLSMFRTAEETEARERGFKAGQRELEMRKQGIR